MKHLCTLLVYFVFGEELGCVSRAIGAAEDVRGWVCPA